MARYATTILAIAAIILASAGSAGAASPSASIVSPSSPVEADMFERLEFIMEGIDADDDLRLCEMYVDGAFKGWAHFNSPTSGATAVWTYAFGTPGTHTVDATPLDDANNYGPGVTWTVEVTNRRQSLELTVLTYNTHLFEDSTIECLCKCGALLGKCDWNDYSCEDGIRMVAIADKVEESEADIVALQEVWSPAKQVDLAELLQYTYPYAAYSFPTCDCRDAWPLTIEGCVFACLDAPQKWKYYTMGNGLILLSKWPLSDIEFERFPTFSQCPVTEACEAWSDKGVLTATVDAGGPIRIGISHALTGPDDEKSKWNTKDIGRVTFQLNGEAYIFSLNENDNRAQITRFEDYSYFG